MLNTMWFASIMFVSAVCCMMMYAVVKRPKLAVDFYRRMRRVYLRIVSADSRIDRTVRGWKRMFELSIGYICGLYKRIS